MTNERSTKEEIEESVGNMSEYLLEKLEKYGKSDFYPLHMPGHKRNMALFAEPFSIDITEINGFDNLFCAEEILQEAQQRAAKLYHAEETYYLVNGSTCGLLAAVSAAVPRGGRLVMARNSHKASYHAVFLRGLSASYLYPDADLLRGINGSIQPEQVRAALEAHGDISAVLITSPTYDGVVSDIKKIAEIVHQFGAILIVDEAHGAHFAMYDAFPKSALACGADLVINSVHKTLPSLTQTALLHVQGERVDRRLLKKYLGIYQTSSPSYVFMAGIDTCIRLLTEQKQALYEKFWTQLQDMRTALLALKHLHLVTGIEAELEAFAFDESKVLISTERTVMTGPELAEILRMKYHMEVEMEAEHYVTAIMTVADTPEGFERLTHALIEIDEKIGMEERENRNRCRNRSEKVEIEAGKYTKAAEVIEAREKMDADKVQICGQLYLHNESVMTIEQAENETQEQILLSEAGGRISAEFVYLYPPGIPLIVPGERIAKNLPEQLMHYHEIGLKLQGMEDHTAQSICVVQEVTI